MSRVTLSVKRAGLIQTEIDLNDPITVGYKQMLVNCLCERFESAPVKYQRVMNDHARCLISPKVPQKLKMIKHRYPQAFITDTGFPFAFTDSNGEEQIVILSPNVPVFFTQEEMSNIVLKAQNSAREADRKQYSSLIRAAELFLAAKDKLRGRQIHYATVLNMPKFNTYKSMLKCNPEFFEKIYKLRTGFDLLEKYKDL